MAMMSTLRNNTKVIIWVIVVAFVGTIIFAWGMDLTRSDTGGVSRGIVGEVNGRPIMIREFGYFADNWIEQQRQEEPDKEFTDTDYRIARKEAWNSFIVEYLQADQIEQKKIKLTDGELVDFIRKYPPQEIAQIQEFQTEGRFDYQKYLAAMNDPNFERLWYQVEMLMSPRLINFKLQEYIGTMVRVSAIDVRNAYIRDNERIRVSYCLVPLNTFDITEISIDSTSVREYYDTHTDDFQREELAYYQGIRVPITASDNDFARAFEEISEIKRELDAGGEWDTVASVRTQDPSGKGRSGDLGWFPRGQMVTPFDSAVFAMENGEISSPVKTRFGYHIIYRKDFRTADGKDEVNAAHILIKPRISQETLDDLLFRAEAFTTQATDENYKDLIKENEFIEDTPRKIGHKGSISGLDEGEGAVAWLFGTAAGSFSRVYETKEYFLILRLDKITPAGLTPFDETYAQIERNLRVEEQKNMSLSKTKEAYDLIIGGSSFADACAAIDVQMKESPFFSRTGRIAGMGQDPNFIGTAFTLSEANRYSKPVLTQAGAAVIEFKEKLVANLQSFEELKDTLLVQSRQTLQGAYWNKWFDDLRDAAEIKDYRREIFGDRM